jgi:hypothetical protein
MLRRVAFVRTDVSEEPGASFIRVTNIGELGTTLAATSNRRTLRRNISELSELSGSFPARILSKYSSTVSTGVVPEKRVLRVEERPQNIEAHMQRQSLSAV